MSRVLWKRAANADLDEIGKGAVLYRLLKMAEDVLCFPPHEKCPDEGWVAGHERELAWRRAVPASGDVDGCDEVADYYFVYRQPTDSEYRNARRNIAFVLVRVLHASNFESLSE
ncbi:hypothetical protein GBF35_45840 [Nonomuraea phyllanthi]|uniref:hypothetical protein n=1 Tax=Nonomuraea phyllanthi TaxID=2219224 RepID=UPI0012939737|nr:hypothetical protein [Nonomuraea phyllanthi]QFY12913.1 hypothetical protein GBF35_45840 [Nonomuraea phyllanthi]